jgi:hypothetical protein
MSKRTALFLAGLLGCLTPVLAQNTTGHRSQERVIAVVPMTGSGSFEDPVRPLFADLAVRREGADDALAFSWEPSDDGKFAIAEFSARHRRTLEALLCADSRTAARVREGECPSDAAREDVKVFVPGQDRKADIERELKKFKRDFNPDKFAERAR